MTEIGSTLGGRYRLLELLGQGGMATIYRARDAQLERDVAVKLLRPEFGQDPDFLARFRDEARAAASLSHPNIVQVYDFGEDSSGPYIVMELVEGQDLAQIIRDNGPLAPRQAARVAADVARALQVAHFRGIVHRDVKPSNILVGRDGRVHVADFGIARAMSESQVTLPGTTMGSVHYFSPEQARGEPATAASDIYSLGIVLFETLTGQRPFSGDGAAAIALARLTTTPPLPSSLRASVPPELDAIVQRAMALEPEARYASAAAMASALEGYLGSGDKPAAAVAGAAAAGAVVGAAATQARPTPAPIPYPPSAYARPPSGPATVSTAGTPPPPPIPGADDDEPPPTGPWAWTAGIVAILVLLLIAFLLFRFLTGGSPSPSASPGASVTVPSFVGLDLTTAEQQAQVLGLTLTVTGSQESSLPADQIISQDPPAGEAVTTGAEIGVVTARGALAVPVPDVRALTEAEATTAITTAQLTLGVRTEVFDPSIPVGAVVSQDPRPGVLVAPASPVDIAVSKGPEPTPSPTPTPTPVPTPPPTPPPTPTPAPTPPPTPTPTPGPTNTGNYVCSTLDAATTAIDSQGFTLGDVTSDPPGTDPIPGTWVVSSQDPGPGVSEPFGTKINLVMADPTTVTCP